MPTHTIKMKRLGAIVKKVKKTRVVAARIVALAEDQTATPPAKKKKAVRARRLKR